MRRPADFNSGNKSGNRRRRTAVFYSKLQSFGADEGTRTLDLRFTKPLLFRLSYIGASFIVPPTKPLSNRRHLRHDCSAPAPVSSLVIRDRCRRLPPTLGCGRWSCPKIEQLTMGITHA